LEKIILEERRKIYIGDLDTKITKQDLYEYFSNYAPIEEVVLIQRSETEQFSFITFRTPKAGDIVCSTKHVIKPG
jgi:RNA recognition motif-containing protein